ncbi:putative transcriptional regulator [Aureibacillus halotolerans]|uniref:Putative transcriptional regulator n=1 Tax=Aureibacillus halotolerans TaxID=1508390 RepID=A0A4R6TWN5_9BACI|nr:putative transcriptional regulator [Aureibacillus halotolerans]
MLKLSMEDKRKLRKVAHALASADRVDLLELLSTQSFNVIECAEKLSLPVSTTAAHVRILEEAELLHTESRPGKRGSMKVCTRQFNEIHIALHSMVELNNSSQTYELEVPIGQFVDCDVFPTCGMADVHGNLLVPDDEPVHFYHPKRTEAELIWIRKGYLEYVFPLQIPEDARLVDIQFSLELCSEAPHFDPEWPSDITVWMNGVDIGSWRSPGDFGGRPGHLSQQRDIGASTQYGLLKTWKVDAKGSTVDDVAISQVNLADLSITSQSFVRFRIGVKDNAQHIGGLNLFGKQFGDHPQAIRMHVVYEWPENKNTRPFIT